MVSSAPANNFQLRFSFLASFIFLFFFSLPLWIWIGIVKDLLQDSQTLTSMVAVVVAVVVVDDDAN